MKHILNVEDGPCPPCPQSRTLKVLQVIDDDVEIFATSLIMPETQNLAHMFGGTCDHNLLGHWAKGPNDGQSHTKTLSRK